MLVRLSVRLSAILSREEGATAVEYGIMVALIAAAIAGTVGLLGGELDTLFKGVTGDLVVTP